MNFIKAVQHATIGYGIRRAAWNPVSTLSLDNFGELHWIGVDPAYGDKEHAELCGPDKSFHISPEDIQAKDWETV